MYGGIFLQQSDLFKVGLNFRSIDFLCFKLDADAENSLQINQSYILFAKMLINSFISVVLLSGVNVTIPYCQLYKELLFAAYVC